jgi:DNA-binding transcriptional MerR regulator
MDWEKGIPLSDLLDWINGVVARFRPDGIGEDSRASAEFTVRTFRHYQTLGCIDPPRRVGRRVHYSFRHYLQGLVIRKLLWERVATETITNLMAGRTNAKLKELLLQGIEITSKSSPASQSSPPCGPESWLRLSVLPGLEVHLRRDLSKPRTSELEEWLQQIKSALNARFRRD